MSVHGGKGTTRRIPYVKRPDYPVHASRRDDAFSVFIPIMGQQFGRRGARDRDSATGHMDRDLGSHMVLGAGGGAQVENADVAIGGDGR